MPKLIIFLGNPGLPYERTRHNFAWLVAEELAPVSFAPWQHKFKGLYVQHTIQNAKIHLLKPLTFMNKSGDSVLSAMNFFKLVPDELMVAHDDIELDFGWIDIKKGGGLAGHNGLRSIADRLKTRDFIRFRLGISRPTLGNVSAYVLSKFSADEQNMMPGLVKKATAALQTYFAEADEAARQKFQKVKLI